MLCILLYFRYHGMWFGQKENGNAGFFDGDKVIPVDDDNQGMFLVSCFMSLSLRFSHSEIEDLSLQQTN